MNIELYDSKGNINDLSKVVGDLENALYGLNV
jgi:hypothetical protein